MSKYVLHQGSNVYAVFDAKSVKDAMEWVLKNVTKESLSFSDTLSPLKEWIKHYDKD